MRRPSRARLLVVGGTACTTVALALLVRVGVGGSLPAGWEAVGQGLLGVVAVVGLGAAAWQVRSRPPADGDESETPYRRGGRYQLVEAAPERTATAHPLADGALARDLAQAAETAGDEGSVEAGLAAARPLLRGIAREVLVAGGTAPAAAERTLDAGSWTTDPVAAAVLSAEVAAPTRLLRARLFAWLRPASAARARIDRAVAAVAEMAAAELPTVPGREAPRHVHIPPPPLAARRHDIDGTVRRPAARPPGREDGP